MSSDMFIKIGDVKGEAQDSTHGDEIDVLAWSWGMDQSGTMHQGGGGGGGKVSIHDLSYTQYMDKSIPPLMEYCSSGKQFEEAKLTIRKAGGDAPVEYYIITMKDVIVTSMSTGGSGGEDRLTVNTSLNFREVETEYQPQKSDGSKDGGAIKFGWNIAENVKL